MYVLLGVSAIILPYRLKTLWRSSPGATRFLGIPTTTIGGILMLCAFTFIMYLQFTDKIGGMPPSLYFKWVIIWPFIWAAVIGGYYLSRYVRRGQGVDIDLNFKEIPPE